MKKFILSLLVFALGIMAIPQAQAVYPGDYEHSYPVWKYRAMKYQFDTIPGWVMNSFTPQGIFQSKPLYLRIR